MLLFEKYLSLPFIRKFSSNGNKTLVVSFGLLKITWMNEKLSQLFLTVIGMGLNDINKVINHDLIVSKLENENEALLEDIDALKETIKNLLDAEKIEKVEMVEKKVKKSSKKVKAE